MTNDNHSADIEHHSEGHQHAIENGDLAYTRSLFDETQIILEYAQHNRTGQAYHETAYDYYG